MHWTSLFNDLPDVSGILLAAVGFAVLFVPEAIKALESKRKTRWAIAVVFFLLGIAGMVSSHIQRGQAENAQRILEAKVDSTSSGVHEIAQYTKQPPIVNLSVPPPKSRPQEKARLQFTFFPLGPKFELISEVSVPVVDGIVTVSFTAKEVGPAQANNGQVWIQLCDGCKFAEEPDGVNAPGDDRTSLVRRKRFDSISPGVMFDNTTLKIVPPSGIDSFSIAFKYGCEKCAPIDNDHPQKLIVHIAKS
jgi:hypothetical protein